MRSFLFELQNHSHYNYCVVLISLNCYSKHAYEQILTLAKTKFNRNNNKIKKKFYRISYTLGFGPTKFLPMHRPFLSSRNGYVKWMNRVIPFSWSIHKEWNKHFLLIELHNHNAKKTPLA